MVTSATSTSSLLAAESSNAVTRRQFERFLLMGVQPLEQEGADVGERDEVGSAGQHDRPRKPSRPAQWVLARLCLRTGRMFHDGVLKIGGVLRFMVRRIASAVNAM